MLEVQLVKPKLLVRVLVEQRVLGGPGRYPLHEDLRFLLNGLYENLKGTNRSLTFEGNCERSS